MRESSQLLVSHYMSGTVLGWPFTYMFSFDFHRELVIPELFSLFLI